MPLILLLLLSIPAASRTMWEVEPGRGIGPLTLGMTLEQFEEHLGPSTELVGTRRNPVFAYFGENFVVQLENRKAVFISIQANEVDAPSGKVKLEFPGPGIGDDFPFPLNYTFVGEEPLQGVSPFGIPFVNSEIRRNEMYAAYLKAGLGFCLRPEAPAPSSDAEPTLEIYQVDVFAAQAP